MGSASAFQPFNSCSILGILFVIFHHSASRLRQIDLDLFDQSALSALRSVSLWRRSARGGRPTRSRAATFRKGWRSVTDESRNPSAR